VTAHPAFYKLAIQATPQARISAAQQAAVTPDSCEPTGSTTTIKDIPVVVGSKESDASDLALTQFSYGSSSSMTLGAGVSYTGDMTGFSADGTTTETSGGSWTFGSLPSKGNNDLYGTGQYEEVETLCYTAGNYSEFWTVSQSFVGGELKTPGITPVGAGDCVATDKGSKNTFTMGTQQTFSTGVQLSAVGFGINLSSQSGFSSDTTLTYNMGADGHPICGVNVPPGKGGSVQVIQVHSSVTQ
jgi:hypothetical protein